MSAVVTALLIALACTDASGRVVSRSSPPLWQSADSSVPRRITVQAWDTVRIIQSPALDTLMKGAFRLVVEGKGFVVYSDRRAQLLGISATGHLDWTTPRDTLGRVRDLRLGRGGNVLALDARTPAIHVVDRHGTLVRRIELSMISQPDQLAPLPNGYVVYSPRAMPPFVLVDSGGRAARDVPLDWPGYQDVDPLARQSFLATDARSQRWALMLALGDGWFSYRGADPAAFRGRYVEHTEFPRVIIDSTRNRQSTHLGRAVPTAIGGYVDGETLSILFGGTSASKGRLLDRYSTVTGAYRESFLLPTAADAVAAYDDGIAVLTSTPRPSILVLRPHPTRKLK